MFIKLKDENGNIKYGRDEILEIATPFYGNSYSGRGKVELDSYRNKVYYVDPAKPLLKEEASKALKEMKSNKASGLDGIDNLTIKILQQRKPK